MNEREVYEWLGWPIDVPITDNILEGMKDVPNPQTDEEHIEAFKAFLRARKES